jgi:hypothetical protein
VAVEALDVDHLGVLKGGAVAIGRGPDQHYWQGLKLC